MSNSVMNRVKMFESASSSPASDRCVSQPSPEKEHKIPKYGRTSPATEPPKWQKHVATTERKASSPVVRGTTGGGIFGESSYSSPSNSAGRSSPVPEIPDSVRPSQFKSQSRSYATSVQRNSPKGSVLGTRDPKLSGAKPSPAYLNRKCPQPESPFVQDAKKHTNSTVGWPSSKTSHANEQLVSLKPVVARNESNPAASYSQDENEFPEGSSTVSSSLGDGRAVPQKGEAFSEMTSKKFSQAVDSDAVSASGTMSSVASLSRNLRDASIVIQDEKESIASGSTSARSSLSVDELSNIALRALRASREEDKKQEPPKAVTTKTKTLKSPRRRRQIQRIAKDNKQLPADISKPKTSTRISVVSNSSNVSSTKNVVDPVSSSGKRSLSDKESRNHLFEVARHRNISASPLTVASKESTSSSKASGKPHPENDSAARMAILAAGRRRLASGVPPAVSRSYSGNSRQSTINTSHSEDASVSTQDSNNSLKDRRTSRMAMLAAAHRHSPVPMATRMLHASAKKQSDTDSIARLDTENVGPSHTKSRNARLVALSATTRSPSPAPSTSETKTESTSTNTYKEPPGRNNYSTSSSSPSKVSPSTRTTSETKTESTSTSTHKGGDRRNSYNTSSTSSSKASPSRHTKSETKTESTSTNTHKEAPGRNNYSTSSSSPSKASPSTRTKSETKNEPTSTSTRKEPPGRNNYSASSTSSSKASASTHTKSETKTESTLTNTHKEVARRNNYNTSSTLSSKASPSTQEVRKKPNVEVKAHTVSKNFNGKSPPKVSAFESQAGSKITENARSIKKPSDDSRGRSRVSDHPAMLAKRGIASPQRTVPNVSRQFPPEQRKEPVHQRSSAPKVDAGFKRIQKDGEKQDPGRAASEVLSSPGGVKAAIDAWTSKSKEASNKKNTGISRSSPEGNRSAPSCDNKVSNGSLNTHDDANAVSSEMSLGSSHASTFFSSSSSHASSKMSVGAPGSFFRPMGNDFEEVRNDNMLGQLSGTSTDDDSSELPCHLFPNSSAISRKEKKEDSELLFLLEQMESESNSEDSGIKLLTSKKPGPRRTFIEQEEKNHPSLAEQDYIVSSSGDISSSTDQRTASVTLNELSTLYGQSLLESEQETDKRKEIPASLLRDDTESSQSSDSRFIKWWQKTDPAKRRQKFESHSGPASTLATSFGRRGTTLLYDDDEEDLFSGLSYDDDDEEAKKNTMRYDDQRRGSFGADDVFSGVSVGSRASQAGNSCGTKSTNQSAVPPPPPPPPLQETTIDHYGTILVNGSQALDSVGSDITSSVLGNDLPKDWTRREATAVITEEMTADIEDEEDTTTGNDAHVISDRPRQEGSVKTGTSREGNNREAEANEDTIYGEKPLDDEEGSTFASSETPKGNPVFMNLGCSALEPFSFADGICGPRSADKGLSLSESQSLTATVDDETDGSQTLPSTLNEYEQKVWDEWNRQDVEADSTAGGEEKAVSTEALERRENAHRELVQFAESAKRAGNSEQGRESTTEENSTSTDEAESVGRSEAPANESDLSPQSSKFSVSQRRILEKFSSTLKQHGLEVLKLNRDKKWQTRYLVVSKEVLWLNADDVNCHSGDRGQCPIGMLWTKRFSVGKEYSITSIDRHGRGGVLLDQLVKVSATARSDLGHPLTKKQQGKFKESVAISVDYTQNGEKKSVVLLCRTTDAAHFLCTGLRVVIDVLKREKATDEI